jgi:MoaA/NifB/PqqE/SkfB family radical SAM enzyme
MAFERTKRVAEGAVAAGVSHLIGSASPESLAGIWRVYGRITSDRMCKRKARRFHWLVETGHPFGEWLRRAATELNPKARACLIRNLYGHAWFLHTGLRRRFRREHGYGPPDVVVLDVTSSCNLRCEGCWAGMYSREPDLPADVVERVIDEAEGEMGVHFFVFTGGEPTVRKDMLEFPRRHPDSQFQLYTNGTLIDERMAADFAECGNVMPMLSIEGPRRLTDQRRGRGTHARVTAAMAALHREGVLFGFSSTATARNAEDIMSDEFVEEMIEAGCLYGWYFQYVPIGRAPDLTLMVSAEQREMMRVRVGELRGKYPIFLADFWNDGPEVNGCMAGGRRYLHITNSGDVEPCVFCHFAVDNIKETTLTEALGSPFFRGIRAAIPYDGNLLRPCMLIDHPEVFREHARRYGARPTHEGAESLLGELAGGLDERAAAWAAVADQRWLCGEAQPMYPYPPGDEPEYLRSLTQHAVAH